MRTVDHVKKMVSELESNRAAKPKIIDGICANIARELSHMRQRALTANLGTLPDVAGQLAIVANRTAEPPTRNDGNTCRRCRRVATSPARTRV